jgi:peptide/nickel transport system substrate-binding protein
MKRKKGLFRIFVVLLAVFLLVGCNSKESNSKSESSSDTDVKKQTGGTLNIAYPTQPQSLDPHSTTAEATRDMAKLIFESLLTLDENYKVIPQLAETYTASDDHKTYTFKLRKGVKFHNGKEMKAEDVAASMTKWGQDAPEMGEHTWTVIDDYTVELKLQAPSSLVPYFIADLARLAAIMPKEIAEKAGPTGAEEYIGTGPFKFIEWKQDELAAFEKFKDYVPSSEPSSGLGGKKEALVDKINWYFVPDPSTRVNGLLSGQYDYAHYLSYDSVPQVKNTPGFKVDIWPYGNEILVFNKKSGLFTDVRARQAVNFALDMDAVLRSAFAEKDFYELDNSLFLDTQVDWYTDAGKEYYNQKDLNKAKQLLKEVGYNGEEIIILTSRDYEHHYNAAVATQQELEKIGMKVKLDVYDWPTLLERRNNPELYDIFFTGYSTTMTPHQYTFLDSRAEWPGWTNNPKIDQLLDDIQAAPTIEEAKEHYAELQKTMWEDLPVINLGRNSRVSAYSEKVQDFTQMLGPNFWNVSVNK